MGVYRGVRGVVGSDFPVLVKLNASDNLEGGLELPEAQQAAIALDKEGIDAIENSAGTPSSGKLTPARQGVLTWEQEAYKLALANRIKKNIGCPVMVVGGGQIS